MLNTVCSFKSSQGSK